MSSTEPAGQLRMTVRDDMAVITPSGQVFMKTEAREFRNLLDHCREQGHTRLVIDLGQCDYISSEGLGIFADLWKQCHDEGKGTMAVVLSSKDDNEVTNLFEITGLARVIGSAVRPSVDDAVNYIKTFG